MLQNIIKTGQKTEKLMDTTVKVRATGYSCIGNMGSESPYIIFEVDATMTIRWHSDNVETLARKFGFPILCEMEGRFVKITAIIRPAKRQHGDGVERFMVWRMISMQDQ